MVEWDKGMDSALWVMQGDCQGRGGKLAFRVPGANVFAFAVVLLHFVCLRNSRKSG
jgi:hypothetical protein